MTRSCSRAVNHAREWIAAEMGRRLPGWFAANKNDPKIRELIQTRELWFLPIQNPDGYDFTFTCGLGTAQEMCDYRVRTADDNRFWRKTLRDNDTNGIYGNSQDGVDPNRNYPAKRGIDEEGASNASQQRDLPRPVPAVGAREPRRRPPPAARQVQGEHQLPLRGPAAADAGLLHDRLLPARLDAVRRHHRHRRRRGRVPVPLAALVGPLRVQRRHDRQRVHELRHHRLDAGDGHLRDARRAHGLQPVRVARTTRRRSRPSSTRTCTFALNVTNSLPNLGRPKNFDNDPSQYQVKPTQDIQVNRFDVSYGTDAARRGRRSARSSARPTSRSASGRRRTRNPDSYPRRRSAWRPRPRASATTRSRATTSSAAARRSRPMIGTRAPPGRRHRQRRRQGRRSPAGVQLPHRRPRTTTRPRSACSSSPPRTTPASPPNVTRRLRHRAALPRAARRRARGRRLRGRDVQHRRAAGQRRHAERRRAPADQVPDQPRRALALRRGQLLHGRRLRPAGRQQHDAGAPADHDADVAHADQYAVNEMSSWAHKVLLELRDYANEGGKLVVDGRNAHQPFTSTSTSLSALGPVVLDAGQAVRLLLPAEQRAATTTCRARPGSARARSPTTSGRTTSASSAVRAATASPARSSTPRRSPRRPARVRGHDARSRSTPPRATTRTRPRTASPLPLAKSPVRLRNWTASGTANEPLRQETVQADYTTTPAQTADGRRDHLDA